MLKILFLCPLLIFLFCLKPSDPAGPVSVDNSNGYSIVASLKTTGWAQAIDVYDTLAYIAQGEAGLAVVSINDPEKPFLLSEIGADSLPGSDSDIRGYVYNVEVKRGMLYLSAGDFGLTIIDGTDPQNFVVIATNQLPKPVKDAVVFRKWLFTSISERGFGVVDITNPRNPDVKGDSRTPGYCNALDISADSNSLLTACGEAGFAMYPANKFINGNEKCTLSAQIDLPGYAKDITTRRDTSIAYVACKTTGIYVIDYSNPSSLKQLSNIPATGSIDYICADNDMIYAIDSKKGFIAIDAKNPSSPQLIATMSMSKAAGLIAYKNYILVTDKNDGLVVIKKP